MALTATFVEKTKYSGSNKSGDKHTDGGGLYLHVKAVGKYWRMSYRMLGKQKTLALGVYPAISLAQARKSRDAARELLAQGIDPSSAKQDAVHEKKLAAASTYEIVAREFHKMKSEVWSEAHSEKWIRMNELYLFPSLGNQAIKDLKASKVLAALRKVEAKGILSTAQDLQQMLGQVFRYAVQTGRIDQSPIPDLKGALKPHIPKHFSAIFDPMQVGELLRAIDGYSGQPTTLAALKLSALFFQRPGNIRAMEWSWINFKKSMLTIPADQMKRTLHQKTNGSPHYVPLADQAIEILKNLEPLTGYGRYVFPGARSSKRPMSDGTINAALRRLDYQNSDHVAHGFRAMARTMMAQELEGIPAELVEAQLGHGKSGPLGSAYDRAEYMPQRLEMMQRWADYLDQLRNGAQVIPLRNGTI
jgi:integrase